VRNVWFLLRKEILQALRDRQLLPLVFVVPVIQLLLFGYVARTDITNIPTVVIDQDKSEDSRELVGRFTNSGYFSVVDIGDRDTDVARAMDAGKAQVGVIVPPGYSRSLARGETARVQVIVDGTDTNTGIQAQSYASRIIQTKADELVGDRLHELEQLGVKTPTVEARARVWYNPELLSVNFMVPGLIGLLLTIVTVQLTSQAMVKERAAGTLEQLMVTPIKRWELILGKILPFVFLGFIDVILIGVVGTFWFKVPLRGSVGVLLLMTGLFLFGMLGQGLFVSTVSKTQQQASVTSMLVSVPGLLLSGFIFPVSSMPAWIRWVTYVVPLRYYLVVVRGVFLKGATLAQLRGEALGMAVLGLVVFAGAAMRFRKQMGD
jgi:ABC-2 type transport system permease protein